MAKELPPRVLLVEDNKVNQTVAVAILARLGYRADVAGDGKQAVEQVMQGRHGLVLMDCQLPVLDGYQATAEIRHREGSARRTPIIAMTGAVLEDRQRCLTAGMDDHIAKPVLLDEVRVVLSRWLGGGDATRPVMGTAVATTSTMGVLDRGRLNEFGRLDATENGAVLISELIKCFLASIPVDLAELRAALHQGDAIGVTRIAHRLKGAAGTVGSSGMVTLCEQLEVLARSGAIQPAGDLLPPLEQEFHRVIRALDAILPRRPSSSS